MPNNVSLSLAILFDPFHSFCCPPEPNAQCPSLAQKGVALSCDEYAASEVRVNRSTAYPTHRQRDWMHREWSLTCKIYKRSLALAGAIMDSKRKPPTSAKDILRCVIQEVIDATAEKNEAFDCFEIVMGQFPSGLPHPDGSQRIANSSQALSSARKKVMTAHTRLSEFLDRGTVPEDLKRSG